MAWSNGRVARVTLSPSLALQLALQMQTQLAARLVQVSLLRGGTLFPCMLQVLQNADARRMPELDNCLQRGSC